MFSSGEYGRTRNRFLDGAEGVWAVRGRHPLVPPGGEVSLYYNDADDVAAIATWLRSSAPVEKVEARFREGYEQDYEGLLSQGVSEGSVRADLGPREEEPWMRLWDRFEGFYERAASGRLWVRCYIS